MPTSISWSLRTAAAAWPRSSFHSATSFGSSIWKFGGSIDGGNARDIWSSTDGASWTGHGLLPFTPGGNDKPCIVFGGVMAFICAGAQTVDNDLWTTANGTSWSKIVAGLPFAWRSGFGVAIRSGLVYVAGGNNLSGHRADVWRSSDLLSWTQMSDMPSGRSGQLFTIGTTLYFFGYGSSFTSVLYKSTDGGSNWTTVSLPAELSGRYLYQWQGVSHNDRIWFYAGGLNSDFTSAAGQVWTFDGTTFTQVTISGSGPGVRAQGAAVVHGGQIYLLGGFQDFLESGSAYRNDVWRASFPTILVPPSFSRMSSQTPSGASYSISHLRILKGARTAVDAEIFHNTMKGTP